MTRTWRYEHCFTSDTAEIDAIIHYTVSWGRPAKIYGPPERCYPAEPSEVDIVRIEVQHFGGNKHPVWRECLEVLDKATADWLYDQAYELQDRLIEHAAICEQCDADEAAEARAEAKAEAAYERRMESERYR